MVSGVSELFRAHGIDIDEREAMALIDAALAGMPQAGPAPSPLTPDEAAIYDEAGMPDDRDALQQQVADGAARFTALLADAIPVAEAARRIGVSRSRLQQMISAHDVWAVRRGSRWMLPVVQLDDDSLLPGWSTVARALPASAHPLEILGFLTTPHPELTVAGRLQTVRDWLLGGGAPEAARTLAAGLRAQAA
jgi:hypothetical protein